MLPCLFQLLMVARNPWRVAASPQSLPLLSREPLLCHHNVFPACLSVSASLCSFFFFFSALLIRTPIIQNKGPTVTTSLTRFFSLFAHCPTLFVTPWTSPLGSSVHRISWARILEWVAISGSKGSSTPKDQACTSCISRWILYH